MNTRTIKSLLIFVLIMFLMLWELKSFGGGAHFNEYTPIIGGAIIFVAAVFAINYLLHLRR